MSIRLLSVESAEANYLLADFRARGFVLLVGSSISEWKDSNLPTGRALTEGIADVLSDGLTQKTVARKWIEAAAFEHIMENCPNQEVLGENLLQLFSPQHPNPLHLAVANLVQQRAVEHIITTNYDVNLEAACRIVCSPLQRPEVMVTESETLHLRNSQSAIFKIHGCVTHDKHRKRGEARTMIYALRREGELPDWKRRMLFRLAAGRRILVCGYSGRDFEICPELARLNAQIVWNTWNPNTKSDDLTPNARRVLVAVNGVALVGDMRKVLAQLQHEDAASEVEPISVERSRTDVGNVMKAVCKNFDEWELRLWRVRTLVGLGAASEGIRLAGSMLNAGDSTGQFEALLNLGRSQFHAGKYKQAINTYRKATALGEREHRREWVLQSRSDMFEALRCHGNWRKAKQELKRIQVLITPNENWVIALRSVLLLRYYYQLFKAIKIVPWKVRQLRERCKALLTVVVSHAKNEQWLELQQAELWADRLDIRFSELYDGPLNPLPSKEGYKQLGYLIAQSMAMRDDLVRKRGETKEDVIQMVNALSEAGAAAELWKLLRTANRFKCRGLDTAEHRRQAFRAWWACEYTPVMRLFVTLYH